MRIGITGGRGFLGEAVGTALADDGHEVLSLDAWTRGSPPESPPADLDQVLHFGARTAVEGSFANPFDTYRHNIESTLRALEIGSACHAAFLFMSSYVYGTPRYLPIDEQHPLAAANPYMGSKLAAEWICRQLADQQGFSLLILRGFYIFGPRRTPGRLISDLLDCVRRGDPITLRDPNPRRDYLYCSDFCRLISLAVTRLPAGTSIYNVGHGSSHSNLEVAETLRRLVGDSRPVVIEGRPRRHDILDVRADVSRLRQDFDWAPRYTLEEGLREIVEGLRSPGAVS